MARVWIFLVLAGVAAGETNKERAARFFSEVWIGGQAEKAREYFAPEVVVGDARGGAGVKQSAEQQVEAIRNLCVASADCSGSRILGQVAEGDQVVTVWVLRARPKTLVAGWLAKGLGSGQVERRVVTVLRFAEGRIVEMTMQRDDWGVYGDLGLINGGAVFLYGMGGVTGLVLMWVLGRRLRR